MLFMHRSFSELLASCHDSFEAAEWYCLAVSGGVLLVLDSLAWVAIHPLDIPEVLAIVLSEAAHSNLLVSDFGACGPHHNFLLELVLDVLQG